MFKSSHSHTVDDKTKRSSGRDTFTMITDNKSFLFILIGALTLVSSSGIDVAPVGLETGGAELVEVSFLSLHCFLHRKWCFVLIVKSHTPVMSASITITVSR